ncbi:hypothetical protein MNAN1_003570 [Malassezia nana]|uniref:MI domain-containing protein n=1 Tax=Malassezia nana TaxID=180528 RepID=A0AAF0ELD8_9BASI|nr:hypothetical protein MNAN1_003570 [Malassezia nana]
MSGTEKRATQGGAPRGAPKPGKPSKGPRDAADGAVSLPKHAARAAQGINFGTVDDQHAEMSSSPAAQPAAGEHLRGAPPAAFGSVWAASGAAPEKNIGFGGKKQLDFQKLFQTPPASEASPAGADAPANASKSKARPAPAAGPNPGPGPGPAPGPGKPMGAAPPYMPGWQPPMYAPMSYPMSPGPGAYPYLASPQQPWTPGTPGSPHMGNLPGSPNVLPPNVSPRPGGMQARPGGASFYPAASPSGFTMNAGARLFEPQKSKALRIVNPETHTEIDLEQVKKASSTPVAKPDSPAPAPAPKMVPPKEQPSESSRVKTQADFQQKVLRLKMEKEAEAKKAAEEARAAEEAKKAEEARAAEEAKKAEEARAAEEAKKAEEARAAEEAKKAEEEAKAAEEAQKAQEAQAAEAANTADAQVSEETVAADALDAQTEAADESSPLDESEEPQEGAEPSRAIESAKRIDDLSSITYPENVQPPKAELNVNAVPGRYRYDREFLLQFMSVYTEKPHGLPDLAAMGMESVAARGGRRGAGSSRGGMSRGGALKSSEERFASSTRGAFGGGMSGRGNSLSRGGSGGPVPSRETMGTGIPMGARPKSNRGRQRDGRPHVNPPEKGGPTIPLDQVVPLAYSENRWKPQSMEKEQLDPAMVVERKVKSLLNKLTVEKFESISDQIVEYANKSIDETDGQTLRQVIALVFEKAIDESAWSEMYAQLCAKIQMNLNPNIQDRVLDEKEQKEYRGGMLFRKYLLTWCQGDFEKGWGAQKEEKDKSDKGAELLTDEYYAEQKAKRRGLGLVQFVGELFKLQMLQPRIMHTCIVRLLRTTTEPEEDEIESVCRLLTTVGYLLDTSPGNHKSRMDVYFKRIDDILQSPALSSRMRFMLMDVVDLRENNWVPRHDTSAPKTIAEIHAEAAKEQQQKEMEKLSLHRGGSRRGQPRHSSTAGGDAHAHDGWSTVGHAPAGRGRPSDLSGLGKGSDRAGGKPGAAGLFQRKGQGSDEPASPSPRSSSNMFNLLTGDGNHGEEKERKKLQLQPRTKPIDAPTEPSAPSAEDLQRKIGNDVKEFLAIRDLNEGVQSIEALPAEHRASFVDQLVSAVLDKKQDSVDAAGQLLAQLVEKQVLTEQQLLDGFQPQVTILDDTSMDAPSAYGFMAQLLVQSTLPRAQIEQLADKMEGEGLRPPKDRLLAKVDDITS